MAQPTQPTEVFHLGEIRQTPQSLPAADTTSGAGSGAARQSEEVCMTAKLNHNLEEPVALIGHGGFCEGPTPLSKERG